MKRVIWLAMTLFAFLASSCNQKVFDEIVTGTRKKFEIKAHYHHKWHVVYEDGPDWEQLWDEDKYLMSYESLLPIDPSGLRALVYHANNDYEIFNLEPYGGYIDVAEGTHKLLFFNNDTEYIIFNDINYAAEASATTRSRVRSNFAGSPFVRSEVNDYTINPPDMLYSTYGGEFKCSYADKEDVSMEFELRPLVYKYVVRYHFTSGLNYVTSARGALSGMASSVYLTDGHTSNTPATLLYDIDATEGKVIYNEETGEGVLYVVVNSFGAPGYPNDYYARAENAYGLNLEVRLSNGAVKSFDYNVTDQLQKQPRGGVIDVHDIEILEEDAAEGEGAFNVDVDGWDDYIEVPFL